jgi:hypothetical protein
MDEIQCDFVFSTAGEREIGKNELKFAEADEEMAQN